MENKVKLPCGLNKDNKLVYIDEAKNGLACECFCPGCHQPLVARQGDKNAHCFAHKSKGFDCEHGYQSALHYMGKDVFLELQSFTFKKNGVPVKYKIDSVVLEKRLDEIIPDIIVNCDGRQFIVEIFVTHAVDDEKKRKIRNMKISSIEINLSRFHDQMIDKETLKQELCNVDNFSWVYDADLDLIEQKKLSIQQFGLPIPIGDGQSIACPIIARSSNELARFVPLEFCLHCHNCLDDREHGCIRCGMLLRDENHQMLMQRIFVNLNKVAFASEFKGYAESFMNRINEAIRFQYKVFLRMAYSLGASLVGHVSSQSSLRQSSYRSKRNSYHYRKRR
ncbi:MAG: hypothetical protein IK015_07860 [Treponema sp.]|nr:hypothetical protein [Treponema sp.]